MIPSFEVLKDSLKKLPGLGYRSAERIALNLLVEQPQQLQTLVQALQNASKNVVPCSRCGNIAESDLCEICSNPQRDPTALCIVESIPDLYSIERSGAFNGYYHVTQGKLSPIKNILPDDLNLASLPGRLDSVQEVILAFASDIESEATCHYIQEMILNGQVENIARIGFGLPSGGGIPFADPTTLKNALESRTILT
jgi:recombination protein RecR